MRAEFTIRAAENRLAPQSLAFFHGGHVGGGALGSGAVLFSFDPAKHGFYPICLFHSLTGWNCPGCGATRAAYQLLHGHLLLALHDNAAVRLTLAVLAAQGAWLAMKKSETSRRRSWCRPKHWAFLIVAFIFTGLRNLPAFAWLSP